MNKDCLCNSENELIYESGQKQTHASKNTIKQKMKENSRAEY